MSTDSNNRREFLKKAALGVALGVAGQALSSVEANAQAGGAKPAAGKLEMVNPKDSMAMALGYSDDATKVDVKKFPKRASAEGKKQFCYNCQFYQANSADPKSVPEAPCTIFSMKGVKGHGWCNSWTQNQKVKT